MSKQERIENIAIKYSIHKRKRHVTHTTKLGHEIE